MTDQTIKAGDELNSLECVSLARKLLGGIQIRVKPYEKCQLVRVTDTTVTLVFETYLVRETSRRTTFLKQGIRCVSYSRETHEKLIDMISWDETDAIIENVDLGRADTVEEIKARREWEADAYRVGSARNPLDNASRTADYQPHPNMTRYWGK